MSIWTGSLVFFSFVVAPSAFAHFDRELAGKFVGGLFVPYWLIHIACGAVALGSMAVLGAQGSVRNAMLRAGLLAGMLVLFGANLALTGPIHRAGEVRSVAEDGTPEHDAAAKTFSRLHGLSMAMNALVILAIAAYWFFLARVWGPI